MIQCQYVLCIFTGIYNYTCKYIKLVHSILEATFCSLSGHKTLVISTHATSVNEMSGSNILSGLLVTNITQSFVDACVQHNSVICRRLCLT